MHITDTDARDREDMRRLGAGDDGALNDLMDRHAAAVFRFLCRMLGNEEDANDLAQETFVRVFRARQRFRPTEKFSTWLFTIAANLARNHFRWRSRHPNIPLDIDGDTDSSIGSTLASADPGPCSQVLTAERADAVQTAIGKLPEDLREAILLCEWEDLSIADAASALQTTPKAIESRLYRARKLLRVELKHLL